jgi:DNA-binding IscR family transcriptional regulator
MQQLDAKAVEVEKVLSPLKDAGLVKSVRSKAGAGYMHGPAKPLVVVGIWVAAER